MPSSVEKAMPLAPKLARRRVPEGGFESISRTKKGAVTVAAAASRRNVRRSVITGLFYCPVEAAGKDAGDAAPGHRVKSTEPGRGIYKTHIVDMSRVLITSMSDVKGR